MPGMQDAAKPLSRDAPFRRAGDLVIFGGITAVDPNRGIVIRGYADLRPELRRQAGEMSTDSKDGLRNAGSCSAGYATPTPQPATCSTMWRSSRNICASCATSQSTIRSMRSSRNPPASTVVRVVEFLQTPDVLLEVEPVAHIPGKR
jgi:hypothetical protein